MMVMENAEAIAERQDKANHMQFGHVDETFNDIDAKYEEIYQEFKKVWIDNPSMSKNEVFKEIGRTYNPDGFLAKHVNQRLVEDGLPLTHKKEVSFEVKESSSDERLHELETFYQEFKDLWVENPNIRKKDAFEKLGETYHSSASMGKYVNQRLKEDGLPVTHANQKGQKHAPSLVDKVPNTFNRKVWEKKYLEYKELFENSDLTIEEIYDKIDVVPSTRDGVGGYIRQRCQEDGLDGRKRRKKIREQLIIDASDDEENEKLYQEYKRLFYETDLKVTDIYKSLGILHYSDIASKYIRRRSKEEGLNANKRKNKLRGKKKGKNRNKKTTPKVKKVTKKHVEKGTHAPNSETYLQNSERQLEKFYKDRNIKESTRKGYAATMIRWFDYHEDKYHSLQDCLDLYIREEDDRIPMRDRTLKKELLGFRDHLIDDPSLKSDKSMNSYFSKVGSFFRHHGLEMPTLPQAKMEKGYVSNYNDLPTHDMIRSACEQSPLDLKAIILFMSSSGSAKAETLSITIEMFLEGFSDYLDEKPAWNNIQKTLESLSDRHDLVPTIYLRRIKTDKWYFTCCSPEASYMIIESLKTRKGLSWKDKLFDYTSSLLLAKFQEINDNNNWGFVGAYRRFRSHTLRKFMASNIGLPRDQVDSFQGRAKDMIQEAYFKQDPQSLKKIYLEAMHRVMVYENWGHGTTPAEIEQRAKRVKNGFNDNEKILDLSVIPETPDEIKSSIGLETDHETLVSTDKKSRTPNKSNSMPITPPVQVPVGTVQGISISKELLQYAELMEKGLLSIGEFNRIKQTLLMSVIR